MMTLLESLLYYQKRGYAFEHFPGGCDKTAILLHGWGVRSVSMREQARMLQKAGYSVLNYDYPTSEEPIVKHAALFLNLLRREKPAGKIYFLTHSMGGLVLRHALSKMNEEECRQIDSIVMLGPPNHGSPLAYFGKLGVVAPWNLSLGDMVPRSDALKIPLPVHIPPIGIIAGKWDEKVPYESTALPDDIPFQRTVAGCTHPGLRNPGNTGALIQKFFQFHRF